MTKINLHNRALDVKGGPRQNILLWAKYCITVTAPFCTRYECSCFFCHVCEIVGDHACNSALQENCSIYLHRIYDGKCVFYRLYVQY